MIRALESAGRPCKMDLRVAGGSAETRVPVAPEPDKPGHVDYEYKVDTHYPTVSCLRVVMDNLSAHSASALYQAFPPEEARRILRRLEFHFVPKHASWLNMVEIGVLKGPCLARRIGDRENLIREVAAWESNRNAAHARINWMFTVDKARKKMNRAYPEIATAETNNSGTVAAA